MAVTRNSDSLSPPPQLPALTKRDVRRNRMMEKLQQMVDAFSANQHQHYRAQLQAIQVDMTLILHSDPYEGLPLEDSGEDIRAVVESVGANLPADEAAQKDYWALAGTRYRDFVREVNDSVERRDAELVALHNRYKASIGELDRLTQQKLHQAEEEHKALSNTIRQRLVTTISKRRQQLLRDKEQLDLADSNALLLHPSQFSINNPGSPGHAQNRKTRHLRHRAASPSATDDLTKRKRKAAAIEDEGNESPAPAFRPLPPPDNLGGGRSPFRDAREKNVYAQFEAPAYSLERIFTDKELVMATDTARIATYRYFHQPQHGAAGDGATNTTGTGDSSVDGENAADAAQPDDPAAPALPGLDLAATDTPPPSSAPAAPEMERTTSHQVLTRGHARANPLAALSDLATVAAAASGSEPAAGMRDNPFAPVIPSYHAVTRSEKSGAPAPPGVGTLDAENDFDLMRRTTAPPPASADPTATVPLDPGLPASAADPRALESSRDMRHGLLDQALGVSAASQPYRLPLLETGPALIGKGVDRVPGTGFAPIPGVLEQRLRAQGVGAGVAGFAGGSMAAALRGGEAMSRTTSAAGSEIGEVGPGRGRRRAGF